MLATSLSGALIRNEFDHIIAIIQVEDHPNYDEAAKVLRRGRRFPLKLDHDMFASGTRTQRASLVFDSLRRSVFVMGDIGVKGVRLCSALCRKEHCTARP